MLFIRRDPSLFYVAQIGGLTTRSGGQRGPGWVTYEGVVKAPSVTRPLQGDVRAVTSTKQHSNFDRRLVPNKE